MNSREKLVSIYIESKPASAARVLETMQAVESAALLAGLPARISAPALAAMNYHYSKRLMKFLPADFVVRVMKILSSQRGAALLRGLSTPEQDAILGQLALHQASALRFLLSYSENLLGAWVDHDVVTLYAEERIESLRTRLQQVHLDSVQRMFVVDAQHRLQGCVMLTGLIQAADTLHVRDILLPIPRFLRARTSLNVAEQHQDWRRYTEMPVLGHADEFIGIISYETLYRALQRLRQGQALQEEPDNQLVSGLTEIFLLGARGAWQTWLELFSLPVEDEGFQHGHQHRHNRGA